MSTCCIYAGHTTTRRILLMSLAICSWGILLHSSCKAAPKAWSVLELSVVHAGRECLKHARLATSQVIEQANRDDPHCSAAGTAVLSSPDEVFMYDRVPRPRTLQALGAALQEEWRRIPQLQIARLIRSMRRRCVACIDATGGHTQY